MSELLNLISKPLALFTDSKEGSLSIVPQTAENNDELSRESAPSSSIPKSSSTSSIPSSIPSLTSTFVPTFEWQDIPEGEHLAYSGLEINLNTRYYQFHYNYHHDYHHDYYHNYNNYNQQLIGKLEYHLKGCN